MKHHSQRLCFLTLDKIKESKKVKMWARDMTEPLRVLAVPAVDLNLGPQTHVRRFATT